MSPSLPALPPVVITRPLATTLRELAVHLRDAIRTVASVRHAGIDIRVVCGAFGRPSISVLWADGPSLQVFDTAIRGVLAAYSPVYQTPPFALMTAHVRYHPLVPAIPLRSMGGGIAVPSILVDARRIHTYAFLRVCAARVAASTGLPATPVIDAVMMGSFADPAQILPGYGPETVGWRTDMRDRTVAYANTHDGPDVPQPASVRRTRRTSTRLADPMALPVGESALADELRANGITD